MRLIFAIFSLAHGLFLLVATFTWRLIPIAFLQSESATGIAFVISALMFIPFVSTYTTLGLNSPEGEEQTPETKARHAALKQACPIWSLAWYSGLGFVLFVWIGCTYLQIPAHPFFAFSGMISCLTGIWFLFVYPVAVKLFQE